MFRAQIYSVIIVNYSVDVYLIPGGVVLPLRPEYGRYCLVTNNVNPESIEPISYVFESVIRLPPDACIAS